MMNATEARPPRSLGDRINRLFEVQRPPHEPQRSWTNREVVAACKESGYELSESHLSELRRAIKVNPTLRTLSALSFFFDVRVGYLTGDPEVAAEVEDELAQRETALRQRLNADREAQEELRAAGLELQEAMRDSGVTKMAHRGTGSVTAAREQASMMRALARALKDDEDDLDDEAPGDRT